MDGILSFMDEAKHGFPIFSLLLEATHTHESMPQRVGGDSRTDLEELYGKALWESFRSMIFYGWIRIQRGIVIQHQLGHGAANVAILFLFFILNHSFGRIIFK